MCVWDGIHYYALNSHSNGGDPPLLYRAFLVLWLVYSSYHQQIRDKMQHSYQRYILDSTMGLISSPNSNVVFSHDNSMAISGALEEVAVWNIKLGSKVRVGAFPDG